MMGNMAEETPYPRLEERDIVKENMIATVPLFASLSEEEQRLLAERMHLEHHSQGELLFIQGEASGALYLIKSGWVRLSTEGSAALASLGPGSLVGEADLFLGRPRSTTAEAATEMESWVLARSDLEELIAQHPDLGIKLSRAFGAKVAQLAVYLAQRLRAVPGFQELEEEVLTALAARLQPREVRRGGFIFQVGDPGEALYILESGQVRLLMETESPEVDYVELSAGAVLGEMPLLTGKPHSQAARAATDVLLWTLPKADFDDLSATYPVIRRVLSRELRTHLSPEDRALAEQRLRTMPLFSELPEEAISAIAKRLLLQHVPAGELVFQLGDPGDALYLIEKGQVELTAGGRRGEGSLARLGPGGFFGEMALLTGRTRSATACALQDTNLWVLYRSDFEDLLVRYPAISVSLNRSLAQRLAEAGERYVNQHLRGLTLLAGLSPQQLEGVAERLRPARYRAGERIYEQGSEGNVLYLIESGEVRVLREVEGMSIPLATLGSGDFFGEMALLNNTPRSATIEAVSDVDLWVLNKDDFETLLLRYPSLAVNLSRGLSRRLGNADLKLVHSLRGVERVAEAAPAPAIPVTRPRVEVPPIVRPRRAPRIPAGLLGALQGLSQAAEDAAVWFSARTAGAKLRLAALLLLLVWLCGIAAPVALIRSLSSSGQVRTKDLATLVYMETANPYNRSRALALAPTPLPPTPTYTPLPTDTPIPTDTPLPTDTPTPTPTATETPVPTPTPTATPIPPTPTPVPPTPTPMPPSPTPEMRAAAAPQPSVPPLNWDGRLDQLGVRLQPANVAPGQPYWRLVEARWADEKEAKGKHDIYVNVLDESGQRIIGQPVVVEWRDGKDVKVTENKPEPEYSFNFNMYGTLGSYNVYVEGLPSDMLVGAGLGDLARPTWKIHTCFYLTFQRAMR